MQELVGNLTYLYRHETFTPNRIFTVEASRVLMEKLVSLSLHSPAFTAAAAHKVGRILARAQVELFVFFSLQILTASDFEFGYSLPSQPHDGCFSGPFIWGKGVGLCRMVQVPLLSMYEHKCPLYWEWRCLFVLKVALLMKKLPQTILTYTVWAPGLPGWGDHGVCKTPCSIMANGLLFLHTGKQGG